MIDEAINSGAHTRHARVLRLLLRLRWLSVCAQVVVIAFVHFVLGLSLPLLPLAAVIAALVGWNVASTLVERHRPGSGPASVMAQLMADTIALTLLLFFSGGPANPFVSLYLIPIALAALVLPARGAWLVAGVCALAYTVLMAWHQPLPHVMHGDSVFRLHVWGMWVNFLLSAAIICMFVLTLARWLRERETELGRLREARLRDEQLLAVGTLAAGTAHALGTPLNTLSLGIEALRDGDLSRDDSLAELVVMQQQIDNCCSKLDALRDRSSAQPRPVEVRPFLDGCLEDWRLLNPQFELETRWLLPADTRIVADPTLDHAIGNLLDNAARASMTRGVARAEVSASSSDAALLLEIDDHGPGLSRTEMEAAMQGRRKGLGLLLSNASIERLGGKVSISPRPDAKAGARTHIELPLKQAVS